VQIAQAQSAIDGLSNENVDGLVEMSLGEALGMAADADDGEPGVLSGIEGLDRVLGPIKPKQLIIVAGRPGMGKSVLAESYGIGVVRARDPEAPEIAGARGAVHLRRDERRGAWPARSGRHLLQRAQRHQSQRHRGQAAERRASPGRGSSVAKAQGIAVQSSSIKAASRLARIGGIVRRWKRRLAARGHPLKLVIVDYLQLLAPDRPRGKKYEEISDISMALKAIAKQQDVGMIAVAQLSRDVETRDNKRPTLADLRDSGQIEQDADGVVFLFRHEYYLRAVEPPESDEPKKAEERATWERAIEACQGQIEFIVAKRRGRTEGIGRGRFYGAFQAVR
jgi:replicative DNA helicase